MGGDVYGDGEVLMYVKVRMRVCVCVKVCVGMAGGVCVRVLGVGGGGLRGPVPHRCGFRGQAAEEWHLLRTRRLQQFTLDDVSTPSELLCAYL